MHECKLYTVYSRRYVSYGRVKTMYDSVNIYSFIHTTKDAYHRPSSVHSLIHAHTCTQHAATGVVYGADDSAFRALADTIIELSDESTLVLLAHGQGAAPGVYQGMYRVHMHLKT